jgi:hypothetical protein
MEAMRTTRLRPIGHKRQFQMINNPIHDVMLREEGNDLHPAPALRAALRSPHETATDHEGSVSQSYMRLPN